jgi:hypothetical protein
VNYRNVLTACIMGVLALGTGCSPRHKATPMIISSGDWDDCRDLFPKSPWESVHRIEAAIKLGGSFSFLGVTKGDPAQRSLYSILLTPEGFSVFEAELRNDRMDVIKAMPPFDKPEFAHGLMEDVSLLFLPPQGRPSKWGRTMDDSRVCYWDWPGGSVTEITVSVDHECRIMRLDDQGRVLREIFLLGPFNQGLASQMELRASGPAGYILKLTLLQRAP